MAAEERISALEHTVSPLTAFSTEFTKELAIKLKLADLGIKLSCNSLGFVGLPGKSEDASHVGVLLQCLCLSDLNAFAAFIIKGAHHTYPRQHHQGHALHL